jgi:hypothetical protein
LKWFSERKGLKTVRTEIQIDSMDDALKNQLWNLLNVFYWDTMRGYGEWVTRQPYLNSLFRAMWHNYFKKPIDTMPTYWEELYKLTRDYFFNCNWNEVYEFLEVIVFYYEEAEDKAKNEKFEKACNYVLERELSAYRFVKGRIIETTSKEEISEIEEALDSPFKTVSSHLENALKLFSDRKSPDYRNSIKESISAVEAICRSIAENKNASLGEALDIIEKRGKIGLHGALKDAFDHLYGYTSSADGIRHAYSEEKVNADYEEAKFMLVACSAFVNYLVSKAAKAGLKLG